MKKPLLQKNDANWSIDGRWQTPTDGVETTERAGRPRFKEHPVLASVREAIHERSRTMGFGWKLKDFPEVIAFMWAAGYAPSHTQKVLSALGGDGFVGSHHTLTAEYRAVPPRVFCGDTVIPPAWLESIRATGHGPWSDRAPRWFRSFFSAMLTADEPDSPEESAETRPIDTLPPELIKTAKLIEALRIHREAQPDDVSDEMVLNALGPPFKVEEDGDDWNPGIHVRKRLGRARSFAAMRLEGAQRMIDSGIPLSVALSLNDLPLPYDVTLEDFEDVKARVIHEGENVDMEFIRSIFAERIVGVSCDPDKVRPTFTTLLMPPKDCFPELVPRSNEEVEPLIQWYHVENAMMINGGAPHLNDPSRNIILRVILEIMAEIYYNIDQTECWELGIHYADPLSLPMQPIPKWNPAAKHELHFE